MSKTVKYTELHVHNVHELMNNENLNKGETIKKAGFTDSSLYYTTMKRLGIKENIGYRRIKNNVSFL